MVPPKVTLKVTPDVNPKVTLKVTPESIPQQPPEFSLEVSRGVP